MMSDGCLRVVFCVLLLCISSKFSAQIPSVRTSAATYQSGANIDITIDLAAPASSRLNASVFYSGNGAGFQCSGFLNVGDLTLILHCQTDRREPSGIYRPGFLILVGADTNDSRQYPDLKLPFFTLVRSADLKVPAFPELGNASLSLTREQALNDASVRAQDLLNRYSTLFPNGDSNSAADRENLLRVVEEAKAIVDLTRRRYLANQPSAPTPIFFQDLDRRLEEIAAVNRTTASLAHRDPRFVLAQLPRLQESVSARSVFLLNASARSLAFALLDMVKGFPVIGESKTSTFSWSLTTTPPGAEIWISRLLEPELKWPGATNLQGQKLEFARWTFRVVWQGCSKRETHDPFLQGDLNMTLEKSGCKKE